MIPFVKLTFAWLCFVLINPYVIGTSSKYYDLSHTVTENISKWPTAQSLRMNVTKGILENGMWFQLETVEMGTHLGTHLDAPCHFAKDAWCVDQIPFHQLVGRPTAVVDIRHKVFSGDTIIDRDAQLLIEDLVKWEDHNGRIPDGAVVLMRSGFSRYFDDDTMYRGTDKPDSAKHSFPGVSSSAAEWLVKYRHIFGVGTDAVSIDYGKGHFETHEILCKNNIYILENISPVLNELPESGAILNVGVFKLGQGASGAPARVVAIVADTGSVREILVDTDVTSIDTGNQRNSSTSVVAVIQLILDAIAYVF